MHKNTPSKDVDDKIETKADYKIAPMNKDLIVSPDEVNNRDTGVTDDTNKDDRPTYDHDKLHDYENGKISMESLTKEERKEARRRKKILAEQEESGNGCHNQTMMELNKKTNIEMNIDAEEKRAILEEQAQVELNSLADLIQKREDREKAALEQEQAEHERLIAECSNKQIMKIAKFRKNARRDRFASPEGNGR